MGGSPSNRSGSAFHMTLVSAEKVETVAKLVAKGGVTSGELVTDERVARALSDGEKIALRFEVLMALYVLAADGRARMEKSGRKLVFAKLEKI